MQAALRERIDGNAHDRRLGGSLAHTSRSLAALRIALGGAGEAGAATKLLNLRELDLPILLVTAASLDRA